MSQAGVRRGEVRHPHVVQTHTDSVADVFTQRPPLAHGCDSSHIFLVVGVAVVVVIALVDVVVVVVGGDVVVVVVVVVVVAAVDDDAFVVVVVF